MQNPRAWVTYVSTIKSEAWGRTGAALRAPPHDVHSEVQEVAQKLLQGEGLRGTSHDGDRVAGELRLQRRVLVQRVQHNLRAPHGIGKESDRHHDLQTPSTSTNNCTRQPYSSTPLCFSVSLHMLSTSADATRRHRKARSIAGITAGPCLTLTETSAVKAGSAVER